ncbi:MAG: plasmid segregation centromere-binding protein ParR [Cyanobacteriota bacterium]
MFHWSKKVVKSVTFSPEVADESLLAIVESVLEKQPNKTFSDLCKEALWQSLCVPESVRPGPKTAQMEQQISGLQHQLDSLEQRFFAKEANRLESIEAQLSQLTQQLAQLVLLVNQRPVFESSQPLPQLLEPQEETLAPPPPPQEVDPLLSRLTPFLDDF